MADEKKSREVGELTVKVAADVGEALTGFKALQRELRETTKAAREMEQAYEDVEKAIAPTTLKLQTHALKDEVKSEASIPAKLRESILAKFAEDEAKIAELERAYEDVTVVNDGDALGKAIAPNTIGISTKETEASFFDLSEVSTKELSEELAKREGVTGYYVGPHGEHAVIKFYDEHGIIRSIDVNGARILVNID